MSNFLARIEPNVQQGAHRLARHDEAPLHIADAGAGRHAIRFRIRPLAAGTRRPYRVQVPDDEDPAASGEAPPEQAAGAEPHERMPFAGKAEGPPLPLEHIPDPVNARRIVGTTVDGDQFLQGRESLGAALSDELTNFARK